MQRLGKPQRNLRSLACVRSRVLLPFLSWPSYMTVYRLQLHKARFHTKKMTKTVLSAVACTGRKDGIMLRRLYGVCLFRHHDKHMRATWRDRESDGCPRSCVVRSRDSWSNWVKIDSTTSTRLWWSPILARFLTCDLGIPAATHVPRKMGLIWIRSHRIGSKSIRFESTRPRDQNPIQSNWNNFKPIRLHRCTHVIESLHAS